MPISALLQSPRPYTYGIVWLCRTERFRKEFFKDLFDLGFDKKAALKGEAIYEDLREKIKASDVVHAAEISWRNDGMGHYAWYAGNSDLAFFHIDRHRSSEVATSILGADFGGVLVTDRYEGGGIYLALFVS